MLNTTHQETALLLPDASWLTEEALIGAARDGDPDAADEIIRTYRTRILSQCLRRGLSRSDAEDTAQEVFIKVFRNLHNYRHETAFSIWLYRITENACMDQHRRRMRLQAVVEPMQPEGEDSERDFASTERGPEQLAHACMLKEMLPGALQSLPPEQREALLAKELDGFTYEEIAKMQGCSDGTVKSRIFRARKKLMQELSDWL